ncbi:ENTH-domain-containing protein [Epithele typhae]|uniref:ENTH-domain-containing protein n=1 Tax=Epithele typhae TaxID=378194 RepID=UPI002007E338|nr:ENTH-domain-containing protein [Epithele typhae]KAH9932729.1 ENTH-domain-containing protein [Epithele typhae]
MDRLESLGNAISQISIYDIKSMYNQAKNVVFNVSEMEGKVRDATNDEPWGASSTLMQDIAQGTFNFQNFNEIMPAIYARFMEKEARQWRQIYKALQLLEYLVKNGSERVVDDARSHVGTIKMLRNFYYVDEKGKDQGINVRNRSKELVELLGDVEKIRGERRKAKANKHKYTGTGNEAMSFSSGGSRYGGFGSDSYGDGSYSGGGSSSYSGGGSGYDGGRGYDSYSGGNGDMHSASSSSRRQFQEYDAGDDDYVARRSNSVSKGGSSSHSAPPSRSNTAPTPAVPEPPKAKQPEVDLLGMDDDAFGSALPAATEKALPALAAPTSLVGGGDDDFDDFQSAPPSAVPATSGFAPAPVALAPPITAQSMSPPPMQPMQPQPGSNNGLFNMLSSTPAAAPMQASMGMMQPMVASPPPMMGAPLMGQGVMTPMSPPSRTTATTPGTGAQQPKNSANFDDLWSMSLGSGPKPAAIAPGAQKSMKALEKEKAQASFWGGQQQPGAGAFGGAASAAPPKQAGNGFDDLLF